MRTLDGFNFRGKVVLVRADLNCDVRAEDLNKIGN